MSESAEYVATANELGQRIYDLIPDHPEILTLESVWDLFGVEGFKCDDLDPSMGQAMGALGWARSKWNNR